MIRRPPRSTLFPYTTPSDLVLPQVRQDQVVRDRRDRVEARLAELALDVVLRGEAEAPVGRSEEHTSELQSQSNIVCRLLLEKKQNKVSDIDLVIKSYALIGG